jgi:hypothetical protein
VAAVRRQQIENRSQPALDGRQPLARVAADELVDDWLVGRHRRGFVFEPLPRPRQREPIHQQQMLDPQHLLDILTPIRPRRAGALRHAKRRKFRLP